jgi:hypothetical protein
MRTIAIGGNQLAIIAAGNDALAVRRAGQDRAAVNVDFARTFNGCKQQGFLAEHEHRRQLEKMHADERGGRLNGASTVG